MNRSTIFEYFRNDTDLVLSYWKIGRGNYPVMMIPYTWDNSFLLINGMRFTDYVAIILFSNELVVKYSEHLDMQVNIPYKDIEYIEVKQYLDIGYMALHDGEKIQR